jgi:hypothetical protein
MSFTRSLWWTTFAIICCATVATAQTQAAKLTTAIPCTFGNPCDDGGPFNEFGTSVAMSADGSTLVVGAPFSSAAYIFVRPAMQMGGWNAPVPIRYVTKLVPSDNLGLRFGVTVAVSNDGGTVVVGARKYATTTGAAYVFVRPGSTWGGARVRTQTAKLTPSDVNTFPTDHSFGNALTISGDGLAIVVGAPEQEPSYHDPDKGAAYVYFRPWNGWSNMTESQKFAGEVNDAFGSSVALSGDGKTLVIGAVEDTIEGHEFEGTVSVYARREPEYPAFQYSYYFVGKLHASHPYDFDWFGYSASVNEDGSVIVVGAPGKINSNLNQGAAYVFERAATNYWLESGKLSGSDTQADSLGISVSISRDGNTIIAGDTQASFIGEYAPNGPGAAYLYWRPFAGWTTSTETSRLSSTDGVLGDRFGNSVSVSANGTTWAAGAPRAMIGTNTRQGAAYVFTGPAPTPVAEVSPASLTFDPVAVGAMSGPKQVTVTNAGTAPLVITSITKTGPFVSTQNCLAHPVMPGTSCVEDVMFGSLALGPWTGTLTFTDNSGGTIGATQHVQLAGSARKGTTKVSIASTSPNPVLPGRPLTVNYVVTPEPGNLFFTPSGTVTVTASTGESCTGAAPSGSCIISFADAVDRTVSASYASDTNFDPSTSQGAVVRVVDFKIGLSPTSQTIVASEVQFVEYTVTVFGVNGFNGTVTMVCAGGPPGSTCAVTPNPVTVAGKTFTATATARLTLPANVTPGVYTVSVKGGSSGVARSGSATLIVR